MDDDATGKERAVPDLDIAGQQGATSYHDVVAEPAVMSDMTAGHDEVVVAYDGGGFGLSGSGDGEVFADLVAIADFEVTAFAAKIFVQGIGTEDGSGADFIPLAQGRPAFYEGVGFEHAVGTQGDVALDDRVFANNAAGTNERVRIDARRRGQARTRVNRHK